MTPLVDTIAAIATPPGEGGLAVIRVSGPDALAVVDRRFQGRTSLATVATHTAHVGFIVDADRKPVDETVCTVFLSPHSYTGETVVEVSCHGGTLVTRRVLETFLAAGARHARPGEFTERAFLNGRIDLSQSEAIADLIHAQSDMAHRSALEQVRGSLLESIRNLRQKLIDSTAAIELELDFVDEGYEFKDKALLAQQLGEAIADVERLANTFRYGRVWREGIRAVIAGRPNVGKSSLLNALLGSRRAIVTDTPGTTRDFIEESVLIEGVQFRLTDTAGLRSSSDAAEKEGVERAVDLLEKADVVLYVVDRSNPMGEEEKVQIEKLAGLREGKSGRAILVANKSDLPDRLSGNLKMDAVTIVETCATTGRGVEDLRQALVREAKSLEPQQKDEGVVVTNSRHFDALQRARTKLEMCLQTLKEGRSSEFVAVDLRAGLDCLGEITGVVTSEEILNTIFARFCIGK